MVAILAALLVGQADARPFVKHGHGLSALDGRTFLADIDGVTARVRIVGLGDPTSGLAALPGQPHDVVLWADREAREGLDRAVRGKGFFFRAPGPPPRRGEWAARVETYSDGTDLALRMTRAGLGVAGPDASAEVRAGEASAREARLGRWTFVPRMPWPVD